MIRRALLTLAAIAVLAPAASAQAQTGDACPDCIDPVQAARQAACYVGEQMGWHCIETTRTATSRSCSRPLGLTDQCLETIICGTPSKVARAAGLDEYGIDPTVNCVA